VQRLVFGWWLGARKADVDVAVCDLELTAEGGLRMRGDAAPTPIRRRSRSCCWSATFWTSRSSTCMGTSVRVNDVDLVWEPVVDADAAAAPIRWRAGRRPLEDMG